MKNNSHIQERPRSVRKDYFKNRGVTNFSGMSYQDVSIRPAKTSVRPDQVSLKTEVLKNLYAALPIFASPMETVWSPEMTIEMAKHGALAPIARDLSLANVLGVVEQLSEYKILNKFSLNGRDIQRIPIIVTCSPFDKEKIEKFLHNKKIDYVFLDSVQPFNQVIIDIVGEFSNRFPNKIILGNIATEEAAEEFLRFPLAGIKVGLGPGSICTTRVITGVGVPQMQAIQEVYEIAKNFEIPVIADGGIKTTGDIAKSLGAGASSVMMGRIFAGCTESPSEVITKDGQEYKFYAGSLYASVESEDQSPSKGLEEFLSDIDKSSHRNEGVSGLILHTGPVRFLLDQAARSLAASFAFVGAGNTLDFQKKCVFTKITHSSIQEGKSHSINKITHSNKFFES